jgi:DNA invertase Pin-like site-specific DNA recombinase
MIEYMEERTKVVIYARVSTSAQDYTRQITELRNYAWKQNYQIVKEFSEKISGGKKIEERVAIKELLDFVQDNKVEKVLFYDIANIVNFLIQTP